LLLALIASMAASAAGPLTPQWGAAPVRLHFEMAMHTQSVIRYYSSQNDDARVADHLVSLNTTCVASPGRRGWLAKCELDDVRLGGIAYPGDQESLNAILLEWEEVLNSSYVQLEIEEDGRILGLDLEGPSKADERQAAIHETMRLLMRRVFTVLDVQAPKDGALPSGDWKQKGSPLAFELFSSTGTAGGASLKHTPGIAADGRLPFESAGRGNVATGANLDADAGAVVNIRSGANGRFDLSTGLLQWCELSVGGELAGGLTASDATSYWSVYSWVGQINADGTVETKDGPKPL
jgi:hypothetical protein